jgi:hypothetical protein
MSDGIHIQSHDTGNQPVDGDSMTRDQAQELYEFVGFAAPFVVVVRKSDRQKGILEFTHNPRVYFNFQAV